LRRFEFATAARILFGEGVRRQVPQAAQSFGARVLLVTGRDPNRAAELEDGLRRAAMAVCAFRVEGEPTVDVARRGAEAAREHGAELVIAQGGGSAIDAGKAVAALAPNSGDPLRYLEVIGEAQPLERDPLPFIAIPTTAGTGSEVTRNAVLGSPEYQVKVSLRSPKMLPRLAVVDPELTYDLPLAITASTGLDAITQLIEPYVSIKANPLTDLLCREGLARASRALPRLWENPLDKPARADMALASLYGGLALANAGLGAVHGFASPIGGMYPAPHGAVCAALLPYVFEVNVRALRARDPGGEALRRYDEIARIVTGTPAAKADGGMDWIAGLCERLQIPPLRAYGLHPESIAPLVEKAARASSMRANPIELNPEELSAILIYSI
jgi:alcohol dehydrogenase class IV